MNIWESLVNLAAQNRLSPSAAPDWETARHRLAMLMAGDPVSARYVQDPGGLGPSQASGEDWLTAALDAVTPLPVGMIATKAPKVSVPAYRALRLYDDEPGVLYPAMVGKAKKALRKGQEIERGTWYQSEYIPFGMAPRKGYHAGLLPRAEQFDLKRPELAGMLPPDMVWTDVSMGADLDLSRYLDPASQTKIFHRRHVPFEDPTSLPEGGMYLYNNRANDPPWIISDLARHNRVLTDDEVNDILRAAGLPASPQRYGGAWTRKRLQEIGLGPWLD